MGGGILGDKDTASRAWSHAFVHQVDECVGLVKVRLAGILELESLILAQDERWRQA